jgi:SNF2 family DNA or RNA helicase
MQYFPEPHQQVAIERMLESPYQLLALRMGAGKTGVSLTAINEMMFNRFEISRVLVIAPKRVAELVWHAEAAKWDHLKHLRVVKILGDQIQRIKALSTPGDVYVINRENFIWLVKLMQASKTGWTFDCVIVDENRGFKDRNSESWKHLKQIRQHIERLFILTGTPAPNTLLELWPQISILDNGERLGRRLTGYRERYFVPDKRNGPVVYTWRLKAGAEKIIYRAVEDVMLSVQSGVVLPARIDNVIEVEFDMARYRELERTFVTGNVIAPTAAILSGKLRQMANGAVYDDQKYPHWIHDAKLDALEEIVDQGEPVLCFTHYKHDQARILDRFPKAVVFDGEPSFKAWQKGEIGLMLMHPASGGHGVDGLQVGGHVAVWFALPDSLDLYEQANARLHRTGQASEVVVHHLVARNTVDERIMQVLAMKGDAQQALIDAVLVDAVNEMKERVGV